MKVATGYDFNGLNAHVSRCLLRQICRRLSVSTNSKFEEGEFAAISSSKMNHIQRFYGALIFVDISGFTALSTRLDIESLTTHINGYFKDMLAIIESFGGDVVKFAGDAMYVIWHAKSYNERQNAVLKAVACAKEIVRKCNNRTVPLSPATSDTTETILKRVELARSLLSGQSALERDADPNFDSNDEEDSTTIVTCNETSATFVSDELESPQSPRSPRVQTHRRRNSLSSHQLKPKTRRLSFPSFSKNAGESTDSKDPEVASLNVHIGVSVGVLAGIDVSARNRSEFFLTGQPLLDVSDAESLAKLGQIVVSKGVYEFLQQNSDLNTNYECVSVELECYRIMEPIILSAHETELRYGPAADVKRELSNILNMNSGLREEQSLRAMLLKCLSSHVHEAARMQSPVYSRCNSPPYVSYPGDSMFNSIDNSGSCLSSVYSSAHSDDSFDMGCRNELSVTTSQKFERKLSFDNGILPDDVLSAELRELVVLFIKIDLNVSLSHSAAPSVTTKPEQNSAFSPKSNMPHERWDNLTPRGEINGEDFVVDKFGFLERTPADESADVALHGRFQACMTILADTFAEHGGQIGQYSCCEKGNVCLGTFGLRGSVQEDNAAAAIESAQTILVRLQAIGFNASIGVTSGKVYSGLVGSPTRHEYSIMGPAANLSSRLMCAAAVGTILCDGVTRNRDRSHLFLDMPSINAKGYSEPVRTYQPVLSDTFRRRLYSRRGSIDSWSIRNLTDDPDVFGMMAIDKLSASRNPETYLFGRSNELDAITQFLFPRESEVTDTGRMEPMKIAIVTGACGCGKTTFLASVRGHIAKDPFFAKDTHSSVDLIFSGGSNSFDTTVPFNSWRPVLTALIAATSKHARSLIKEEKYTSSEGAGRYTCRGLFSPIDSGELGVASFSPMGRFSTERMSAFSSKPTSPMPPASCISPSMDDGCVNSPTRRDTESGMTPGPLSASAHRFSHLRAGCALITDALPASVLSHLHLIFKILPSFSKISRSPKPECSLTGAVKLQKTVEVLSSVIQTAVDLIRARRIFITLDDVQSLDPSSWNLLTHMWRSNTAISVLASFHSLSRSSARGKVVSEGGEIDFQDFKDHSRCLVTPLAPLDKAALSQLVAKMLETSDLTYSQVSIITEAAVDLAGGNPLFAREITISAVETFKDCVQTDVDNSLNSESVEEATLSHVINTLRPRHRIEEIISLRFDRLTPSHQLVLKLATVVAKDGASFTADLISHMMKELSNVSSVDRNSANKSSKHLQSRPLRTESLAIVNLNSINVEETLRTILNSNEFIRLAERTSHRLCSPNSLPVSTVKYKFKNILIKKSIYDLMLNHQKLWSHQKVAEYLEAQALIRVAESRSKPVDDSDDELEDVESVSREEGEGSTRGDYSDCGRSMRGKEFGAIADWNALGVHWRLSNNLIKAMACFYESGHLVDSQGDIETARLLWTEAYEILCLMRKDSKFSRDLTAAAPSEKSLYESLSDDPDVPSSDDSGSVDNSDNLISMTIKNPPLGSFRTLEEKSFGQERSQHASECIYHVFKGDSLALELAITLIVRLSQNILMFQEQPEDVVNLNNEALELVSCTRRTLLERDAVTFIHVPRLSPSLFLKGSCLLGPMVGGKERRQSITLKDGKKLFCLRDPSMIFPVFSGLCMRYSGDLLPDDNAHKNWSNIVDVYLATARDSKIPVHIIRSLSLKSLLCYCCNDFAGAIEVVYKMDKVYVYHNHSEQLIHIYGADRALLQYTFGAVSSIILGDFQQALHLVNKAEEFLGSLTHLQSVLTTSMLQYIVYLLMQQYDTAYSNFISLLSFISFNGGQHNMFHLFLPLYAELGKRLGYTDSVQSSATSPPTSSTRRGSTTSLIGSVVSDMDAMADLGTLGETELESLGYPTVFDYKNLLIESRNLSVAVVDARKNPVPVILALRYGKGTELVSAELCLLEAKRMFLEECQPHHLKRNSITTKEEESGIFEILSKGGSAVWRSVGASADSQDECDLFGEGAGTESYSDEKGPRGSVVEGGSPSSGSGARDYCEAGLRFLDFSFESYPLSDSTLNSLQCYIVKADTLVTLHKIQEYERLNGGLSTLPQMCFSDLPTEARKCLCAALDLGVTYDLKLSTLLVGIAFIQLGLDGEHGSKLLREFMLFIMNLNRTSENVVVDVDIALDQCGGEYDWMHSFPILVLAKSLMRGN